MLRLCRHRSRMLLLGLLLGLSLAWTPAATGGPPQIPRPTLTHGPLVGGVTGSSAVVWMRASTTAQVRVRYGTDPDLGSYVDTPWVLAEESRDFTAKVGLDGLAAETVYYFDLLINDLPRLSPPYPHFKTFAPAGEDRPFRFVILTDFRRVLYQGLPHAPTFASAAADQPDFVLIGGDFDHNTPDTLWEKRAMFRALYSYGHDMDDFVNLILRQYPVAHVWDDHDYGQDGGDKTYPNKALSLAVLDEYFPVYPMTPYGAWQRFRYGQADLFLLDSRSQRDPNTDPDHPGKSMLDGDNLGESGQLQWLLQGLQESTATWKFVKTPSVFNPTPEKLDSWAAFGNERQVLLDAVASHDIQGVVLLSGDLHFGAIDDGTYAGLPEMLTPPANCKSCITNPPSGETGLWSEGTYVLRPNCWGYGVVTVLTNPDRVALEVKDASGAVRLGYTLTQGAAVPTVSVGNIQMRYRLAGEAIFQVQGRVPIRDESGQPMAGAEVRVQWTKPGGQTAVKTATTRANGSAYFRIQSRQVGTYVIEVLDVYQTGYVYDPALNDETWEDLLVP